MISDEEIEKEVESYALVANNVVGLALITFALAIISINNAIVQFFVWISLWPVIIVLLSFMFKKYPKTILELKDGITTETYTEDERKIFKDTYNKVMKKHLNWKIAFTKSFIYIYGFIFYFATFIYIAKNI